MADPYERTAQARDTHHEGKYPDLLVPTYNSAANMITGVCESFVRQREQGLHAGNASKRH
jgi:hypothetical protein